LLSAVCSLLSVAYTIIIIIITITITITPASSSRTLRGSGPTSSS
jgi:hypothetical protein